MNMNHEVDKLVKAYETRGYIVVGLDFDNTIYPLEQTPLIEQRCEMVRQVIRLLRPKIKLCLWTVANDWTQKYKVSICEDLYGIELDAVNQSVLYEDETVRKPFFDILVDDNAGLSLVLDILGDFHKKTELLKEK